MNASANLRDYIQKNRATVLAAVLIVLIVLGYLVFAATSLLPGLQARSDAQLAVDGGRQQLAEAQAGQNVDPASLQAQIDVAQAALTQSLRLFLTDTQASDVIDALYGYAGESGVTIVDLQTQPSTDPAVTSAFSIISVQLTAQGSAQQLVGFVSRIRETSAKSFIMLSLNVVDGDPVDSLTMTLQLYTSPFATGEALSIGPLPPLPPGGPLTPTPDIVAQLTQQLDSQWAAQNWPQVIVVLEQLRAVNPGYPSLNEKFYAAYVNYGYRLLAEGRIEDAKTQFNQALVFNPGGGEAVAALNQINSPTPPPRSTVHTVQFGDTLFSIARRYGTTVEAIRVANGLVGNNIRVGQQLIIPLP